MTATTRDLTEFLRPRPQLLKSPHGFDQTRLNTDPNWPDNCPKDPALGKPKARLWTSTHTPHKDTPSDWVAWGVEEFGDTQDYGTYSVLEMGYAKILTIRSLADLTRFMTRRVHIPHMRKRDSTYGIDWGQTVRAWGADALRLTAKGHRQTRYTEPYNTYAWDCESTAWLNLPEIISVSHVPKGSPGRPVSGRIIPTTKNPTLRNLTPPKHGP